MSDKYELLGSNLSPVSITFALSAEGAMLLAEKLFQPGKACLQCLKILPNHDKYVSEAIYAYVVALPFSYTSPAVMVFCALLRSSLEKNVQPLALQMPKLRRRTGAKTRRLSL